MAASSGRWERLANGALVTGILVEGAVVGALIGGLVGLAAAAAIGFGMLLGAAAGVLTGAPAAAWIAWRADREDAELR